MTCLVWKGCVRRAGASAYSRPRGVSRRSAFGKVGHTLVTPIDIGRCLWHFRTKSSEPTLAAVPCRGPVGACLAAAFPTHTATMHYSCQVECSAHSEAPHRQVRRMSRLTSNAGIPRDTGQRPSSTGNKWLRNPHLGLDRPGSDLPTGCQIGSVPRANSDPWQPASTRQAYGSAALDREGFSNVDATALPRLVGAPCAGLCIWHQGRLDASGRTLTKGGRLFGSRNGCRHAAAPILRRSIPQCPACGAAQTSRGRLSLDQRPDTTPAMVHAPHGPHRCRH